LVGKHSEWKHNILFNRKRIEQCTSLKKHTDFLPYYLHLVKRHFRERPVVVKNLAFISLKQSNEAFKQNRFPHSALADDKVGNAFLHGNRNIFNYLTTIKPLAYISTFYHASRI